MAGIDHAQLHWDAEGQPHSTLFNDVYFAKNAGLAETEYVFLQHNQLAERFRALAAHAVFTLGETGFGTGLNLLATMRSFLREAPASARLHFVSVEQHPLNAADLRRALALWPDLASEAQALLASYALAGPGLHRFHLHPQVDLTLIIADASAGFDALLNHPGLGREVARAECAWSAFGHQRGRMDAWFLDGFAPAKNPGMWSEVLFERLARLSAPGTTFATFTAAGLVRRGLAAVGFEVHKVAGFGSKRDMLCGLWRGRTPMPVRRPQPSWHLQAVVAPPPRDVAVIGAGLAGAHTARKLAEAGLRVSVFDSQGVAAGGSGNPQGALYAKLSATASAQSDFNRLAYSYAQRLYRARGLFADGQAPSGLLQLAQASAYAECAAIAAATPELVRFVEAAEASQLAGVDLSLGGLYFAKGGWLRPREVCSHLLAHPYITVHSATPVAACTYTNGRWQLFTQSHTLLLQTDAVVLACAQATKNFSQTEHLPVKPIRGQVETVAATESSAKLKLVLCGDGYLPPADHGQHCLGATFSTHELSEAPLAADTAANLALASRLSPAFASLAQGTARVAFRCATPDYLPLLGPVAKFAEMTEAFAGYRRNATRTIDAPGRYWPGLFVNVGHGSRGLAYTPLAAELLASMMLGTPLPLPRELVKSVHPARFIVRDLARNRL